MLSSNKLVSMEMTKQISTKFHRKSLQVSIDKVETGTLKTLPDNIE